MSFADELRATAEEHNKQQDEQQESDLNIIADVYYNEIQFQCKVAARSGETEVKVYPFFAIRMN